MNDKPIRPTSGFAAVQTDTHPRTAPWIITGSVRSYARETREWVGEAWAFKGETPLQGWKRAREAGIRIIKVEIHPTPLSIGRGA